MNAKFALNELKSRIAETVSGADGWDALVLLEQQNQILQELWGDDPMSAVTADLYLAAGVLAQAGLRLAKIFAERSQPEHEEHAWRLRSKAICTAHSFERHRVGPAMLDWADCSLRLGKRDTADAIYIAIIKDFKELLRQQIGPDQEVLVGLESLKRALLGYGNREPDLLEQTKAQIDAWHTAQS